LIISIQSHCIFFSHKGSKLLFKYSAKH